MFSMTTVALSTRMPTASANPPSVMVFSVWPAQYMTRMAAMIESGIDARMISVSRQLPRNSRIIRAVRPGGHQAAHDHAVEGGFDENRLIEDRLDVDAWRAAAF